MRRMGVLGSLRRLRLRVRQGDASVGMVWTGEVGEVTVKASGVGCVEVPAPLEWPCHERIRPWPTFSASQHLVSCLRQGERVVS